MMIHIIRKEFRITDIKIPKTTKSPAEAGPESCSKFITDGALSAVDSLHTHMQKVRRVGRIPLAPGAEDFPFLVGQDIEIHSRELVRSVKLEPVTAQCTTPLYCSSGR